MNILFGILLVIAGTAMSIKSDWLVKNFGHSEWAEAKMGSYGGTRTLIKLIGIAVIILGMLMATGLITNVILGIVPKTMMPIGPTY